MTPYVRGNRVYMPCGRSLTSRGAFRRHLRRCDHPDCGAAAAKER